MLLIFLLNVHSPQTKERLVLFCWLLLLRSAVHLGPDPRASHLRWFKALRKAWVRAKAVH
jgi:hypothetical protein